MAQGNNGLPDALRIFLRHLGERFQLNLDRHEELADFIMQPAADLLALLFLHGQQPVREMAQLGVQRARLSGQLPGVLLRLSESRDAGLLPGQFRFRPPFQLSQQFVPAFGPVFRSAAGFDGVHGHRDGASG